MSLPCNMAAVQNLYWTWDYSEWSCKINLVDFRVVSVIPSYKWTWLLEIIWENIGPQVVFFVWTSLHQYSSSLALHVVNKINMIVTRGKLLGMSSYNSAQLQDKLNKFFTFYCNMLHIWWNYCCKKVQDYLLDKTLPSEEFYD